MAAPGGGPPARPALARCVDDPPAFLANQIGASPAVHRGGAFGDLFSLEDADACLTGHGLRRPAIRLVEDGEPVDPASWTRRARTGSQRIDDLLDPARALDAFAGGATVVFQSLQRWWPPLSGFCGGLQGDLGHPTQANAYLTPTRASGLAPHHDTHDVFVLQVHGTKDWVIREPVVTDPLGHHRSDHDAAAAQPLHREVTLGAGDVLYLPRGWVHAAHAQQGVSLHLTVGVLAVTMQDVLSRLVMQAADDLAVLRRSFPAWETDPAAGATAIKEALGALAGWLDDLDPGEVATAERSRLARSRRPRLDGQLRAVADLDAIGDDTPIRPREGVVRDRELVDGRLVLITADRRISLPGSLAPVLDRVLEATEPLAVGDLADVLDAASRAVLVRRLVREAVVVPAEVRS